MTGTPDAECGCRRSVKNQSGKEFVFEHHMPAALTHYYPLPKLTDGVVPLYRGFITADGKRYRGVISLGLNPRPTVDVSGIRNSSIEDLMALDGTRGSAKWVERPTVEVKAKGLPKPPKTAHVRWRRSGGTERQTWDPLPIEVGTGDKVDEITFFLLNGWRATDGWNICHQGQERAGGLVVTLGDWNLRIEPRGDHSADEVRRTLRSSGDCSVTHVGRIRRSDLANFSAESAMSVLSIIESLASFALGRVTSIVLPVGSLDGKAVWSRWSALRAVDRPLGVAPWLDGSRATAQLTTLFECGYAASLDPLKWEVFERMLGYYFSANFEATVTMKVMLPVSALQMLGFAYCVETLPPADPAYRSRGKWKNMTTETQLRHLLEVVGADLSLPAHFEHLLDAQAALSQPPLLLDALACIVKMRNDVAHPKRSLLARWSTYEWAEAGFVAMGFFDLALLWWLGYTGTYMPRRSQFRSYGDAVPVPWAPSTP